jgi:urease accessory protein
MVVSKILGNLHDDTGRALVGDRHVETVVLSSAELVDDSGARGTAVVVSVLPSDVLVIAGRSLTEMAFVAHALGNRHLQAQFFDQDSEYGMEVMVVQYDHTVQDFLDRHGVPYSRQDRVMPVPFRHTEHTH